MRTFASCLVAATLAVATPAVAQESASQQAGTLELELNALKPADNACQLTFLVTNDLGAALDGLAYEFALFGSDGGIDQLVTLDFGGLDADRTRVLQFAIPQLSCGDVSRILINDATTCSGNGIAESACIDRLSVNARPDIAFGL